jgi:hypothetical protein
MIVSFLQLSTSVLINEVFVIYISCVLEVHYWLIEAWLLLHCASRCVKENFLSAGDCMRNGLTKLDKYSSHT